MKTIFQLFMVLALIALLSLSTQAQTCTPTPPVCVATGNQPAFTYSGNTNFKLQFNDMPGVSEYQFTNGSGNKVFGINALNGNFSTGATGALQVGVNRAAFQFSGNPNAGLYFTGGSPNQYQFRSLTGANVFTIDENDGDLTTLGSVTATGGNSSQWNQAYGWGNHASAGYVTVESDPKVATSSTGSVPRYNGSVLMDGSITDNGVGNVTVNAATDVDYNLHVSRGSNGFGADKAVVYAHRNGSPSSSINGGTGWNNTGVDASLKGFSNWGNQFSAAVYGAGYLDYENSAAVLGSHNDGNLYGALGFRDASKVWAGYFKGGVRVESSADQATMEIQNLYAGSLLKTGLDVIVSGDGTGLKYGIQSSVSQHSTSSASVYGSRNSVFRNQALGTVYGVTGEISETFSGGVVSFGVYSNIVGDASTTTGTSFGVRASTSGDHKPFCYGVRGTATTPTAVGTTRYGVYGWANGAANTWAGYFNGAVYGTSYTSSDRKLKKDIEPIENALELISRLQPKTYAYDLEKYSYMVLPEGKQYGMIAQDLDEVLPGLTKTAMQSKDETREDLTAEDYEEFLAVNYTPLIPIAIKGIQEQQKAINQLEDIIMQKDDRLEVLEDQNQKMEERLNLLEQSLSVCCMQQQEGSIPSIQEPTSDKVNEQPSANENRLDQNVPNPFSNSTEISYYVSATASTAQLRVIDMEGKVHNSFELEIGNGKVNIHTDNQAAGQYMYSLIIDGEVIATKKMIRR